MKNKTVWIVLKSVGSNFTFVTLCENSDRAKLELTACGGNGLCFSIGVDELKYFYIPKFEENLAKD